MFESNFQRKLVDDSSYFKTLVVYINNNPIHHGICTHPIEYPWSSYLSSISFKPTKIKRDEVIGWFNDKGGFKEQHEKSVDFEEIDKWLNL